MSEFKLPEPTNAPFYVMLGYAVGQQGDSAKRAMYIQDAAGLTSSSISLLTLQGPWQEQLTQDSQNATIAALGSNGQDPSPGQAAAFQSQYNIDNQRKEALMSAWETVIQTDQGALGNDADARAGNFSLAQGMSAMLSHLISLFSVV